MLILFINNICDCYSLKFLIGILPNGVIMKHRYSFNYFKCIALGVAFSLLPLFSQSNHTIFAEPSSYKEVMDWGSLFGMKDENTTGIEIYVDDKNADAGDKLMTILHVLKNNYYRDLSTDELLEAMSKGVANSLDSKYTYYLTPEENKAIEEEMAGEYYGIGCTITTRKDKSYEIVELTEGSPAKEAGLLPGDVIIKVNDKDASEFQSSQELATEVRGELGTSVSITVYRASDGKTHEFSIKRDNVVTQQVKSEKISEDVAIVQIREFSNNLYPQFEKEMKSLVDSGVKKIVFDMRNNPGGDADNLKKCLDLLLDEGPISAIKGRQNGQEFIEKWRTNKGKIAEDMKYAILVNKNSASAAELFSGCLRDRLGVPLIGENTYGKGAGTSSWTMLDDSAINVTIFEYYLPKGEAIEGKGLKPTFEIEDSRINSTLSQSSQESTPSTLDIEETEKSTTTSSSYNESQVKEDSEASSSESIASYSEKTYKSESEVTSSDESSVDTEKESKSTDEKSLYNKDDAQLLKAIEYLNNSEKQIDDTTEVDVSGNDESEDLSGVIFNKVSHEFTLLFEPKSIDLTDL